MHPGVGRTNANTDTNASRYRVAPSFYLPEIPRISIEEVKAKLDAGANIIIVDSAAKASYNQSRIVGAVSIPLANMAEPYSELDGYDEIITYCACPDEETSASAAEKLMEAGYSNTKALEGGLKALKAAGFPVEGTAHGNQ